MTAARSSWQDLLALALPALDHVYGRDLVESDPAWTLGGGTAIAIQIDHRISFDIDIFLQRGKLKALTPAHNPFAKRISDRFQWPGHYLKFERREGEVDFLSAGLQTEPGFTLHSFRGRSIALETPAEVITKKVRFRSERFAPRDAFDLAAVSRADPDLPVLLAREVPDALARLSESLRIIEARGLDIVRQSVMLTPNGEELIDGSLERARSVLADAERIAAQSAGDDSST